MTVDIARMDHNAITTLDGASDALQRLGAWVEAASNARRLVAPLVMTAFVPDAYKPRVDSRATDKEKAEAYEVAVANATAAVLQGLTLGIDPLMALQQIYIVHGRPGMYAKMMVALVQSHGHEVWTEDGECTDTRAVVYGRRRGTERVERITITMDQARKAGWTTNQAYNKTPQDMLWSRAASRVCDRIASDVLKGIASVEQIQDELAPANGTSNGTRTVAPRRQPRKVAATVGEPALDEEPAAPELSAAPEPDEPDADPEPDLEPDGPRMVVQAQHRKMHALWRKLDYGGEENRENRLTITSKILGRELESSAEMTHDEATVVIDALEARLAKQAEIVEEP